MKKTIKLYEKDSYQKTVVSKVVECREVKGGYEIALEETVFFPEGGGQYGDRGKLGKLEVLDTQIENDQVWHKTTGPLKVGEVVEGEIDFALRFERMQQHTGEHIFSGLVHRHFGFQNVGFHLGDEITTMDFSGPITKEEIWMLEEEANRIIQENQPVHVEYPSREEAETLEYRSKIEVFGQLRLVQVGQADVCACCAPHLRQTGEVGILKVVDQTSYKGGVRISILCGQRAFLDYQKKQQEGKQISRLLSQKEGELTIGVERLKKELEETKRSLKDTQMELFDYKAEILSLKKEKEVPLLLFEEKLSVEEARHFLNKILEKGFLICGIFLPQGESEFRYILGSKTIDVREIHQRFLETGRAKGGGKSEMVQGSIIGSKEYIQELWKF